MKLINFTPHVINIVRKDGTTLTVPPSGQTIRVMTWKDSVGVLDGIECFTTPVPSTLNSDDLPKMEPGERGIVSMAALEAIKRDLPELAHCFFSPGELIRDDKGQPIGCKGLNL